jgi:hypothetical protein
MTTTGGCAGTRERIPELALGVLDGAERAEALLHVNGCARCQALLDEHSEIADLLPQLAPEIEPPEGFARRVLAELHGGRRRNVRRWAVALAAAAAAVAVTSVAAVRVIDANRETTRTEAAPALRSVAMTGGGFKVGKVTISGRTQVALIVNVDYALADGDYTLELRPGANAPARLGSVAVTGGHGEWKGTATLDGSGKPTLAMLDSTGAVVCEATLPAA